jgi:hypothetical protein
MQRGRGKEERPLEPGGDRMLWVTRRTIRVNRAATGWLIRRFLDPAATFRFAEPEEVADVQRFEAAIGFDAPGARYPHKDERGRCSFEALAEQYCPSDGAMRALALIVHHADFPRDPPSRRWPGHQFDIISLLPELRPAGGLAAIEAEGLRAISHGFPLVTADDHETLERSAFVYDALYASLRQREGG